MEPVNNDLQVYLNEKLMTEINDAVLETVKKRKEFPKHIKVHYSRELKSQRQRLRNNCIPVQTSVIDEEDFHISLIDRNAKEMALKATEFTKSIESLIDRAEQMNSSAGIIGKISSNYNKRTSVTTNEDEAKIVDAEDSENVIEPKTKKIKTDESSAVKEDV